jgi:hypothetical protein
MNKCDFIQFSATNSGGPRIAVWAVPDASSANAGNGMTITSSKFGNENLVAGDYRILYADEGSGATNGVKFPELAADSTGYVQGHIITNNMVGGNATGPHPIIYSTTPNLSDLTVTNNHVAGTLPEMIVKFRTPPTGPDRLTSKSVFGPFTGNLTEAVLPFPMSNANGVGYLQDPQGMFQRSNTIRPWSSGSSTSFKELLTTAITGFTALSSSKANITDAYGGADAVTLTMTNSSAQLYNPTTLATNAISGMPLWVEFDLKNPNDGNAASQIYAFIGTSTLGQFLWRRCIEVPAVDKGWVTYAYCFTPRTASDVVYLQFTATGASEAAKTVSIGRPRVYHANERQVGGTRPAIAAAATSATGSADIANDLRNKLISLGIVSGTPSSGAVTELGTPSSGTLTNCTALPVSGITSSTSSALGVGSVELGHATDTTVSRTSAGQIAVEGNPVGIKVAVPATAGATGVVGQWAADSSWLYVCTASNTWVRAALATW